MKNIGQIAEQVHRSFEARTQARDRALAQARKLTRLAAHATRAVHRNEYQSAQQYLAEVRQLVAGLKSELTDYPDLFYAGYTQDAIKEFAEASITYALVLNLPLPTPADLGVEVTTYINGLAEVPGELRRRCLDILRQGYSQEAERLLFCMDEIYALLITLDYPDAVTNGLRRQTDLVRGIVERTRGDLTISLREQQLAEKIDWLAGRLPPTADREA